MKLLDKLHQHLRRRTHRKHMEFLRMNKVLLPPPSHHCKRGTTQAAGKVR